ncbi:MAG: MipA/OmpV family protein [Alphaproteobacteria bacterium]|nr:MipA/OmpV family protein [Alphaproteobacteria bacterium]
MTAAQRLALCFACLLAALPAQAGKYLDWGNWLSAGNALRPSRGANWAINVAAGPGYAPTHIGGSELESKPLVLLEATYKGRYFFSTQQGIGWNLYRSAATRIGPRITVDFGRDANDAPILNGLENVNPGVEAGLFIEHFFGAIRVRGDLRQELLNGHNGFVGGLDVAFAGRVSPTVLLALGAQINVMGDNYADAYFSVPVGAVRADRPFFPAVGGVRDIGLYGQAQVDIAEGFYLALDMRGNRLLGDAASSPLTLDEFQFFLGALAGYRF